MKCPTKVRQAMATQNGRVLVVSYEDGVIQVFLIVDHSEPTSVAFLKKWRKYQLDSKMEFGEHTTAEKTEEYIG